MNKDIAYFFLLPYLAATAVHAVSALWQIADRHQLSLGFTHSQRAPQIQELFSDGFHHATRSFEQGNAGLGKEISNNLDLGYRFNGSRLTAEINLFHNWVNDYIFQQRSSSLLFNEADGRFVTPDTPCDECFPVLNSRQANAIFKGFEAQTNAGENETSTPSYLLLNLGAQYRISGFLDSEVVLFAKGKNLLNENIRNSTSYLRNFAPEPGCSTELGIRISY